MNYRLFRDTTTGHYYIRDNKFPSISSLIQYYKKFPLNEQFKTFLLYPVPQDHISSEYVALVPSTGQGGNTLCLSVHSSVCLSACLFVCLSVCLSICLFVCLSVCLSICLFVCLFVCLFICLFVCLSVCLFICLFVCLFVYLFVCLSVCCLL